MQTTLYPPAENSRRTQIAGTTPTYRKAADLLQGMGPILNYGAGLGLGAGLLGWDTLEPYPPAGFQPSYRDSSEIAPASYSGIVCLNVLNVVAPAGRQRIVEEIARILRPGDTAIVMTRGRDVLMGKTGRAGPEPWSRLFGEGEAAWYQKGFSQAELHRYIIEVIPQCRVMQLDLGPAAVLVRS